MNHFAADVDPVKAKVMYAVQQPLHASALEEVMGTPAWKSLPSWFQWAPQPPKCRRHVAMVSHPDEVVTMIEMAAAAVPVAT